MPYKTEKDVPPQLKHLGLAGANHWALVYDRLRTKGKSKSSAAAIAMAQEKR